MCVTSLHGAMLLRSSSGVARHRACRGSARIHSSHITLCAAVHAAAAVRGVLETLLGSFAVYTMPACGWVCSHRRHAVWCVVCVWLWVWVWVRARIVCARGCREVVRGERSSLMRQQAWFFLQQAHSTSWRAAACPVQVLRARLCFVARTRARFFCVCCCVRLLKARGEGGSMACGHACGPCAPGRGQCARRHNARQCWSPAAGAVWWAARVRKQLCLQACSAVVHWCAASDRGQSHTSPCGCCSGAAPMMPPPPVPSHCKHVRWWRPGPTVNCVMCR
jgi:hypothetical protein